MINHENRQKIYTLFIILLFFSFLFSPILPISAENIHLYSDTTKQHKTPFPQSTASNETYDYIIITTEELEQSVEFFKNWKNLIGFSVNVVTVSWITSQYDGFDTAEQIRSFLQEKYQEWNIQFLLIVGTGDLVPWRYAYQPLSDNLAIPTDYYYADLSSDWDSDNDHVYAEYGEDDLPDFTPELYVGRIPVDDPELLNQIFKRIIKYEQNDENWKKNTLLLGAITNFENEIGSGNKKTDTAELMELLKKDIFESSYFPTTTLYEKEGISSSDFQSDYDLTAENVQDLINKNDYGIITWGSHGTPTNANRKWWEADKNLNNLADFDELGNESFFTRMNAFLLPEERPPFVFSCSCSNAKPEEPENLGATLVKYGAIGFIGSSHYSYYTYGWDEKEDGGTMSVTYYFFKNFILQNKPAGPSLYDSLSYCWDHEDISVIDPNMYVFTLYGDPSLSLTAYSSLSPTSVPTKPLGEKSLKPDVSYSFSTVSDFADQDMLYYVWDFGDGTKTSPLGPYPAAEEITLSHTYEVPGNYRIKVKAVNMIGDETVWSDPLLVTVSGPVIRVEKISGGFLKVNAVVKNVGDQDASNIDWSISFQGGLILLGKHSTGTVSTLAVGEKTTIISKAVYGLGFPSVITVDAGISQGSSDVEVQSADIMLSLIRIT